MSHDWLKSIFKEEKKLFKISEIKHIQVPKYDELSIKNLYGKFMKLPNVKYYFPDTYPKGRQADREYTFNIVNTLHPEILKELIEYALNQRYSVTEEKQ